MESERFRQTLGHRNQESAITARGLDCHPLREILTRNVAAKVENEVDHPTLSEHGSIRLRGQCGFDGEWHVHVI